MLYDANETMKLLGKQFYYQILNDERKDAFNDMMNAHRTEGRIHYFDLAMDAFMLGYIYGKRVERARKRRKVAQ